VCAAAAVTTGAAWATAAIVRGDAVASGPDIFRRQSAGLAQCTPWSWSAGAFRLENERATARLRAPWADICDPRCGQECGEILVGH